MKLVMDYKENETIRNSLFKLGKETFGIDYEAWFNLGYWNDRYICYSYVLDDEVISNVSVNKMDLIINGKTIHAIQLGTIMTNVHYLNQGLAKQLIQNVLKDYEAKVDFIYLFANDSVLNFYPRFGFKPLIETEFILSIEPHLVKQLNPKEQLVLLDLDKVSDYNLVHRLTKNRVPVSSYCGVIHDEHLTRFYLSSIYKNQIHYLKDYDCIVIMEVNGETIHLIDVISEKVVDLNDIIQVIVPDWIKEINFHFKPQLNQELQTKPFDQHCFVIANSFNFNDIFRFPSLSLA
jgi:predicted GNAT family N-acyltransferase